MGNEIITSLGTVTGTQVEKAMKVWLWEDAPKFLRELKSERPGVEGKWIALMPSGMSRKLGGGMVNILLGEDHFVEECTLVGFKVYLGVNYPEEVEDGEGS